MDVVELPLERLIPYARNPRKNAAAVATVAASLKEFGWRQPIVVDEEMVILAGHTRLEAARQLGLATAPVHIARGLTPAQARAYRLMDNRASENAEWDEALLGLELGDLQGDGFDLALTGFDDAELNRLLAGLGDEDGAREGEDEVPETPVGPGQPAGRSLAARAAPAALRRLHGRDRRRAGARRRDAAADDQRSTLWGGVRPELAQPGRSGQHPAHRQGAERRPRRLARGLGAVPGRRRLRLARRAARDDGGREPGGRRLPNPVADHLGQGAAGAQTNTQRRIAESEKRSGALDRPEAKPSARPRPSRARPGVPPRSPRASSRQSSFVQNNLAVHTPALRIVQNCATNVTQLCTEGMGADHRLRAGLGGASGAQRTGIEAQRQAI